MILLIDNYDSFVYNLARYFREAGQETRVVRNDQITVGEVFSMEWDAVVLSPGPCTPQEAGISVELVRKLPQKMPLLGVCLGHQAIASAFGGRIVRAPRPVHGRTSEILHESRGLFHGLPDRFPATRYHSLMVEEATLPDDLMITARTPDGLPMSLAHASRPIFGMQFHPESVLTEHGRKLIENFLSLANLDFKPSNIVEAESPREFRHGMIPPAQSEYPLHW